MLVLSRRRGERVVLPDLGVVLTVVEIETGRVRLGIEAPAAIEVHRQEVWDRARQARNAGEAAGSRSAAGG